MFNQIIKKYEHESDVRVRCFSTVCGK